jgi:hypothetical protein
MLPNLVVIFHLFQISHQPQLLDNKLKVFPNNSLISAIFFLFLSNTAHSRYGENNSNKRPLTKTREHRNPIFLLLKKEKEKKYLGGKDAFDHGHHPQAYRGQQ